MKRLLTALVVVLAFAVPVSAQQAPSDFPPVPGGRHAEVMLSVSFGDITYSIDLETLLAGLVTFDDNRRYVALRPFDGSDFTIPTFVAGDFVNSVVGLSDGVAVPTLTPMPLGGYIAVAVPHDVPLDYVAFGRTNPRNFRFLYALQVGGPIMLENAAGVDVEYDVWASQNNSISVVNPGNYVFFGAAATVPTP